MRAVRGLTAADTPQATSPQLASLYPPAPTSALTSSPLHPYPLPKKCHFGITLRETLVFRSSPHVIIVRLSQLPRKYYTKIFNFE